MIKQWLLKIKVLKTIFKIIYSFQVVNWIQCNLCIRVKHWFKLKVQRRQWHKHKMKASKKNTAKEKCSCEADDRIVTTAVERVETHFSMS